MPIYQPIPHSQENDISPAKNKAEDAATESLEPCLAAQTNWMSQTI